METIAIENFKQPWILLVEDEPIVQKVHSSLLEKFGCHVDLAENGEQALAKSINDYDIIFMDVGLPDISGIDVTKKIRLEINREKQIPIIVLTGYVQEDIKNQCLAAGADAVFTKPISSEKLKMVLQNYVKQDLNIAA